MSPGFPKAALIATTDTTGVVEFARGLAELGYSILSAGAAGKTLASAGVPFQEVSEFTGHPELCGGRLRLIHPMLFAGIIADRRDGDQMRDLDREKIPPIDLVAVNLYPLAQLLGSREMERAEAMDFIDISAAALLRAAARNFRHVLALCDPEDYLPVLELLKTGRPFPPEKSQSLAAKAFFYASYHDSTVAQFLKGAMEKLPDEMVLGLKKAGDLRHGENPQQEGALYTLSGARPWGLNAAELLHGKALSYNHYLSIDRAAEIAAEFDSPACAIAKYGVPAGAAASERIGEAARWAYESDPPGCTGGTAALNREVDPEAAAALAAEYLECIAAPDFSGESLDILRAKKGIRLVRLPSLLLSPHETDMKTVSGGLLVQDRDYPTAAEAFRTVSRAVPSEFEKIGLDFAWRVSKHATTFSAVIARGSSAIGISSSQTSPLDAVRLAIVKSQERHPVISPSMPVVMASDAPLGPAEIREAAEAKILAVIHPGGSAGDRDAIAAADAFGLSMVLSSVRHFRH